MSEIVIRVHGVPAPQGSKRHVGNGIMVESSKRVKPWREAVKYAALEALRDSDRRILHGAVEHHEPIPGPVRLDLLFLLPRPKGHHRTGRFAHLLKDSAPLYPAGKPDLDKIVRSTLDGLGEAAVWRDDAQVVGFDRLDKAYAEPHNPPGALIRVRATARTRVGDTHPDVPTPAGVLL